MTNIEMMWGMISMVCLIGIGYILGVAGAYSKYLKTSCDLIEKMSQLMNDGMELYRTVIKKEFED